MTDPDFFSKGEYLKASKLNDLVIAIRERGGKIPAPGGGGEESIYRPFDPIDVDYDGEAWTIRLKPSWVIEGNITHPITWDGTPLTDYPDIDVEEGKNLCLDPASRVLSWEEPESTGKLVILKASGGEGSISFENMHPSVVVSTGGQFSVSVRKDGEAWKVKIKKGFVRSINASSGGGISYTVPTGIDDEHEISSGQVVYVKVMTGEKGEITSAAIEILGDGQETTHYQPPPSGANGTFFYKIARVNISGEVTDVLRYQDGGPIIHTAQLWEGVNVGGGPFEVFESRDAGADNYRFRTLKNLGGDGQVIIKAAGEGGAGETIDFKRIAPRVTNPQIKVNDGGDNIRVEGNGLETFAELAGGGNINVVDGLVTSVTPPNEGLTAKITWQFTPYGGSTPYILSLDFEDGILIGGRTGIHPGEEIVDESVGNLLEIIDTRD